MSFIFASIFLLFFKSMGLSGLEPPTSRLSGVRSNRLSYKPSYQSLKKEPLLKLLAPRVGFEPTTLRLNSRMLYH